MNRLLLKPCQLFPELNTPLLLQTTSQMIQAVKTFVFV